MVAPEAVPLPLIVGRRFQPHKCGPLSLPFVVHVHLPVPESRPQLRIVGQPLDERVQPDVGSAVAVVLVVPNDVVVGLVQPQRPCPPQTFIYAIGRPALDALCMTRSRDLEAPPWQLIRMIA